DDGLLSQFARLGAGEEQGSLASVGQHISYAPLGKAQHVAPLTEHDDLALLRDGKLLDQSAEGLQLGRGQCVEEGPGGSWRRQATRPFGCEVYLRQAVADH